MRLIDADALFKAFERTVWYDNADRDEVAEEILLQMPTIDAVPVVRCKDCKHNNERLALTDGGVWCEYWGTDPDSDGFCYKGERRSE